MIDTIKDYISDKGCQLEGDIAKAIIEYDDKLDGYDIAYFIMKKLRENLTKHD